MVTAQEPCVRLARKSTLLYAGYTARAGVATKVPWRSPTWLKVIPTEPVRSSERSKLLSAETLAVNRALNGRSEEHTSELQSLMRISYAVFCLKKKKIKSTIIMSIYIKKSISLKYITT